MAHDRTATGFPSHPWIRTDLAPIFVWTIPQGPTDADLHACFDARMRWARDFQSRCAWVVDLRNIRDASATQRRAFAQHLDEFERYDIRSNAGSAIIAPNRILAGLVTAVFWIKPPKFPNKTFTTFDDALEWARKQLRDDKASGTFPR